MMAPDSQRGARDTLLEALEAADAERDPSAPSHLVRDRAAYAEALHLSAPSQSRTATGRTLQRLVALGATAAAVLVVGAGWFVPPTDLSPPAPGARVDAWRVSGRGAEPLRPRDVVKAGDMVQLTVSADEIRRVSVWTRDAAGTVVAWFPEDGTLIAPGERVPIDHQMVFDPQPGTEYIAVHVCPPSQLPGRDPWTEPTPPDGCRPFLFSLKKQG